jgi:hypothetical protein
MLRRWTALFLALSLLLSPALLMADEATNNAALAGDKAATADKAKAGIEAAKAKAAAQASGEAQAAPEAPALPDETGGAAVSETPTAELEKAKDTEVGVPKEDPSKVAPGKAIPDAKPTKYHFANFALGFVGGALLGGAYGVLSSGGKDSSVMATNAALFGGGAAVVLGVAGLLLGATTPEEAKPPKVSDESALPRGVMPLLAVSAQF